MSSVIKVAIAGLGRSGWNIHAACLAGQAGCFRVTAVADQIAERRREAGRRFQAAAYSDYAPMLAAADFDLLINALPTHLHVPATLEAIEKGCHVVCEKPMATTVTEFDRLQREAEARGVRLFPFQNNRLQPFFDQMLAVMNSGSLGRIVHVRSTWGGFRRRWDWQTRQEFFGGSLYNTGPHAVDQALLLYGEDQIPEVFCRMDCNHTLGGDADDFCSITLFDPERQAPTIDILLTAQLRYPPKYMYAVSGTCGTMIANAGEVKWSYFNPERAPDQEFWPDWSRDRQYPREELDWTEEVWRLDDARFDQAVGYTLRSLPSGPERFYRNLHRVLTANESPLISLPQVRRQIAVIEECHRQNSLPRTPRPAVCR